MLLDNVYTMNPHDVRFDDTYVVFNPVHSDLEYEATKENISRLGQLDPILILDGLCVDGRHRTRIAKELGIDVRCVVVPTDTKSEDIIVMCNKGVMSGRDYDVNQKAIQALELVNAYGMSVVNAAKLMKVDRRVVSYAGTIKGLGRSDILDTIMKDKTNRVQLTNMDRPSRSLELLAKFVKTEDEKFKVVVNDDHRIRFSPDAYIKTEVGKAWYYNTLDRLDIGEDRVEIRMLLAELSNFKYVIEEQQC